MIIVVGSDCRPPVVKPLAWSTRVQTWLPQPCNKWQAYMVMFNPRLNYVDVGEYQFTKYIMSKKIQTRLDALDHQYRSRRKANSWTEHNTKPRQESWDVSASTDRLICEAVSHRWSDHFCSCSANKLTAAEPLRHGSLAKDVENLGWSDVSWSGAFVAED